jgi:PAS domain S-box-containing protein
MSELSTIPEAEGLPLTPPAGLEERFAAVIESLPDAILCINREWYITYANPEAIRISRLLPELFPTAPFFELFPDVRGTEMETRYRAAMSTGHRDHFEFYYPRFDVWVDIHVLPTDDGFAVFYRDITAAKEAEAREAAITRQVRQVFEAIPDGVVIVDQDWRFSFANQRALEVVGQSAIVGHNMFELFPGNHEEPFGSSYRTTMALRVPTEFEAFHTAPINAWLKVQAKPFALHEQDAGIIIFFSDITARKEAEMREKETARRLAQTLEVTSDAVCTLDREWRYTFLNSNAHELIDPEMRLLGKNIWDEFPLAVGGPAWEIYHRSMDEGVSGTAEIYYPEPVNAWLRLQSEPMPEGIVIFFRDITEERLHDEVVREQQELLAAVQSAVLLATWDIDLATGKVRYGAGSYPVYGHALEDLPTRDAFHEIVHPDYRDGLAAVVERSIQTGERFSIDVQVVAADGSTIWIEARGQAILDANGVATRLRGMGIDISELKRNEASLLASEARYRVLADLNPQAIWMGDAEGDITYANQGFLAYIGLTLDTIDGLGWLDAFAPEDRERVVEVWTRSVTSGVDYDIEAHLRQVSSGTYRWWHLRAAPIRDASGAILHWLGVGSDIHDMRTYAENLRTEQAETERRRAELETIYRTTPIGLALFDPVDFRFLNLNDQEAEMLGYPKEYILGRRLSEIAPPDKVPALMGMMQAVAAGNVVKDRLLEGELAARPGEQRAWRVNYSPIFNEDGSVRAISTASIEITNQKKAESALIQSEKLAAVGRLASSISHEINNPLEAITNLLYLIAMEDGLPSPLKGYVHMAQSELSRVSQIATQTLRFHRQAVAPTPVSAQELVAAVVRLYTGRLANSNIRVDARYDTDTKVLCFENDIRQVLNNLIANAIDAMRTGGRLIIRAHDCHDHARQGRASRDLTGQPAAGADGPAASAAWTRNRRGIRITIADTGHGMTPPVRARIFEPFFTTKDLNGTGLGLWISAGIVERHQGTLRVRSTADPDRHGTVFTLFLPCEEGKPAAK